MSITIGPDTHLGLYLRTKSQLVNLLPIQGPPLGASGMTDTEKRATGIAVTSFPQNQSKPYILICPPKQIDSGRRASDYSGLTRDLLPIKVVAASSLTDAKPIAYTLRDILRATKAISITSTVKGKTETIFIQQSIIHGLDFFTSEPIDGSDVPVNGCHIAFEMAWIAK